MDDVKKAADKFEEIAALARKLHDIYDDGLAINISGIGEPTVLLTSKGFELLFPMGAEPEMKVAADGELWRVYDVTAGGVRWKCWEHADDV